MKKIMFNDRFGLTQAVLEGRKTMTRRVAQKIRDYGVFAEPYENATYKVGEVVAIAQSYKNIIDVLPDRKKEFVIGFYANSIAWTNKMYSLSDLMPHHIRITDIKVERLQDISDEDCMAEGIQKKSDFPRKKSLPFYFEGGKHEWDNSFRTPREAFAALIDKVSGKGTWERNAYVLAYTFELID